MFLVGFQALVLQIYNLSEFPWIALRCLSIAHQTLKKSLLCAACHLHPERRITKGASLIAALQKQF